jgi:succinylarginine dihydrolase
VLTAEVSVQDAVKSYLFNTQILTLPSGEMAIIAPTECRDNPAVSAYLARLVTLGTPIKDVHYMDVKQSMRNGGPACLLRVAMNDTELAAVNPACLITDSQFARLISGLRSTIATAWRWTICATPPWCWTRTALDELTQILKLGSVYPFQR